MEVTTLAVTPPTTTFQSEGWQGQLNHSYHVPLLPLDWCVEPPTHSFGELVCYARALVTMRGLALGRAPGAIGRERHLARRFALAGEMIRAECPRNAPPSHTHAREHSRHPQSHPPHPLSQATSRPATTAAARAFQALDSAFREFLRGASRLTSPVDRDAPGARAEFFPTLRPHGVRLSTSAHRTQLPPPPSPQQPRCLVLLAAPCASEVRGRVLAPWGVCGRTHPSPHPAQHFKRVPHLVAWGLTKERAR